MSGITAALRGNRVISHLSIDVGWTKEEDGRLFSLIIKENHSLKSLRLFGWVDRTTLSVAEVAEAVEGSKTLVSLELNSFIIDTCQAWALARSLSSAKKVQQLELVSCRLVFTEPTNVSSSEFEMEGDSYSEVPWAMQPFVHMLRHVESLRKLRFPLSAYTLDDQRVFFKALAKNTSIEEVCFKISHYSDLIDTLRISRETGAGARLRINSCVPDDEHWEEISKRTRLVGFRLRVAEAAPADETHGRFTQLSEFRCLSSLIVHVEGRIKAEHAEILAQFLRDSKSLSRVSMNLEAKHMESVVLLDGLWHSTSIATLVIEGWCKSRRTARLLADVVCSSKKLRALAYNLKSADPSPAFFSALARSVKNNVTIFSVKTYRAIVAAGYLDRIQEVLARNCSLLVRAARIVTSRTDNKSCTEALKLIGLSPMLVDKVREMSAVNEKEAVEMMRKRLGYLDDMNGFMRAAGVVRDSVVCEESPDGRPGLEALLWLCWKHLRKYLRLVHVADQPEMLNKAS
ncbi:hypothetical protein V5799_025067 [Amblyomma americanum]|uniref:Uncharacterized protein n=1 Tax=Amblyomma americanum TaxID=6943 RepID=A0AAQ4EAB3_AMBAM